MAAVGADGASAATQPNIVLVLTDDQRSDTLWAMPNVRREFVERGVTFENGFVVNSLCCPSRASILTGLYSHSTRIYANTGLYGGFAAFRDGSTVATWLQASGYETGYIGKYLTYYQGENPYIPPGWSRWFAYPGGFYNYFANVDGVPTYFGATDADYSTDVFAAAATRFIRETSRPFFLVFSPYAPHYPATPARRHANAFSDLPPWRPPNYNEEDVSDKPEWLRARPLLRPEGQVRIDQFRREQYRSLLAVDEAVGQIVSTLAESGELQNTLLVYTSDNGIALGEHRRLSKSDAYEESVRVPFVVRYDGVIERARVDRHLVLNIDLAPTFADAAGAVTPRVEGKSLLPLLSSPTGAWRTDFLVEHMRSGGWPIPTFCALRDTWSTYVSYETGEEEFYDLTRDRYQLHNLARDRSLASVIAERRARVRELCDPPPPIRCTKAGTAQSDYLAGTSRYDVLCSGSGNDTVRAYEANDRVRAGAGADRVAGHAGNDHLAGGDGADVLSGGSGADRVAAHGGNDYLAGHGGNDYLAGGDGADFLRGGTGTDRVEAHMGNDVVGVRDGLIDYVRCGPGRDSVVADRRDRVTGDCEAVRRR